jgi:hypothetical protein
MIDLKEQCLYIKFSFKLGITPTESFQKRKNERSLIFDRFCNFRSGVTSVNDAEHSDHPFIGITDEHVV